MMWGTPPSRGLYEGGVAKYSNFGLIEGYILETVQDMTGGKLVLITNRKLYGVSIGTKISDLE